MPRQVKAIINLGALRDNFNLAKAYAGQAKIVAVIKTDAYGHGAVEVARVLNDADMFGVASLEEARQLRLAGFDKPILLLSGFHQVEDLTDLAALHLDTVIHCVQQVEHLLASELEKPLTVWLKIDSGMHRLGVAPEQLADIFHQLKISDNVAEVRLMSHFATADDPANTFAAEQLQVFNQATTGLEAEASLCNSAALLDIPQALGDWVRPGIMLYGGNPFASDHPAAHGLKPVMTLESQIVAIRTISKGESVGYGRRWVATRESRIGTLSVGYGDGYPRHAANGTPVLVRGKYAPLTGTVSMDLISIDLTDIADAQVGDKAILWGEGLPAELVAQHAGTINYALFTGVTKRVPRVHIKQINR